MKTNAARILDRLGIPYEILAFEVDENNLGAEVAAGKLGLPSARVFKTLVARTSPGAIVLACIPADAELDLKALGTATGAKRVVMVQLGDLQSLTGYVRGGVSPLGTKRPIPVFIDQSANKWPTISVSAGLRGHQILLSPKDLTRATGGSIYKLTRRTPTN
ncbi:MAG TPA: Cys-tRNA(Pro) deacylase [Candidatus Latescibacteria bacterium]|nr:Cys-tRNA(Pro) deacylase [Gemmatimonadota bacterium]HCR19318.1 Cys-tRNA(Pro) deacylase [Candidatus Latescibacterota bacterium]|tara:strand:+ start:3441 stop:3923 length:483 start_codon:yes stop_codon:yes gene_type:complete